MKSIIIMFFIFVPAILVGVFVCARLLKRSTRDTQTQGSGKFEARDKYGVPVLIEWRTTGVTKPEYGTIMRSVADLAVAAYLPVEMEFLKQHTDLVATDDYFKQFAPFFTYGAETVDWKAIEGKMAEVLRSMYVSELPDELKKLFANDTYYVITVKDAVTQQLLGFTLYLIAPYHPKGAIWCGHLAVAPDAQNRGLGKLLVGSILKIVPSVNRIMLATRVTNETAFRAYTSWGFVEDKNPIENPHFQLKKEHWRFLEYRTDRSEILQKSIERFL